MANAYTHLSPTSASTSPTFLSSSSECRNSAFRTPPGTRYPFQQSCLGTDPHVCHGCCPIHCTSGHGSAMSGLSPAAAPSTPSELTYQHHEPFQPDFSYQPQFSAGQPAYGIAAGAPMLDAQFEAFADPMSTIFQSPASNSAGDNRDYPATFSAAQPGHNGISSTGNLNHAVNNLASGLHSQSNLQILYTSSGVPQPPAATCGLPSTRVPRMAPDSHAQPMVIQTQQDPGPGLSTSDSSSHQRTQHRRLPSRPEVRRPQRRMDRANYRRARREGACAACRQKHITCHHSRSMPLSGTGLE